MKNIDNYKSYMSNVKQWLGHCHAQVLRALQRPKPNEKPPSEKPLLT